MNKIKLDKIEETISVQKKNSSKRTDGSYSTLLRNDTTVFTFPNQLWILPDKQQTERG